MSEEIKWGQNPALPMDCFLGRRWKSGLEQVLERVELCAEGGEAGCLWLEEDHPGGLAEPRFFTTSETLLGLGELYCVNLSYSGGRGGLTCRCSAEFGSNSKIVFAGQNSLRIPLLRNNISTEEFSQENSGIQILVRSRVWGSILPRCRTGSDNGNNRISLLRALYAPVTYWNHNQPLCDQIHSWGIF